MFDLWFSSYSGMEIVESNDSHPAPRPRPTQTGVMSFEQFEIAAAPIPAPPPLPSPLLPMIVTKIITKYRRKYMRKAPKPRKYREHIKGGYINPIGGKPKSWIGRTFKGPLGVVVVCDMQRAYLILSGGHHVQYRVFAGQYTEVLASGTPTPSGSLSSPMGNP